MDELMDAIAGVKMDIQTIREKLPAEKKKKIEIADVCLKAAIEELQEVLYPKSSEFPVSEDV